MLIPTIILQESNRKSQTFNTNRKRCF